MYTHFPSLASNKPNVHAIHADKKVFFCNYFFTTQKSIYIKQEWECEIDSELVNEKLLCE